MTRDEMLALARRGAQVRIAELTAEIARIKALFQDRAEGAVGTKRMAKAPRRTRTMNAAQRAEVSARMKRTGAVAVEGTSDAQPLRVSWRPSGADT